MKMKLITFVALATLVLSVAGCAGTEKAKEKSLTFADAKALAAERGVPILLELYTDW